MDIFKTMSECYNKYFQNMKSMEIERMLKRNCYILLGIKSDGSVEIKYPMIHKEKGEVRTMWSFFETEEWDYVFDGVELNKLIKTMSAEYAKVIVAKVADLIELQSKSLIG